MDGHHMLSIYGTLIIVIIHQSIIIMLSVAFSIVLVSLCITHVKGAFGGQHGILGHHFPCLEEKTPLWGFASSYTLYMWLDHFYFIVVLGCLVEFLFFLG
jgi:hypothetical protein